MNPAERSVLREGIVAGRIGAAVVAIWFFVFDLLRGRPFLTPTLLGSFVFFGVNTPAGLAPSAGPILGYTVLHGLAFVAFGIVAATMMAMSEREPSLFVADASGTIVSRLDLIFDQIELSDALDAAA